MKSYDGFFLMEFIIKNILPTDNVPEILLNGGKLLVHGYKNYRFDKFYTHGLIQNAKNFWTQ
jgi:hypothetical protein